ncbi:MAG: phosphonate metabolism protein/1,5-bisphosphokinase (PRPP-forming) PhnN [Gammaproteobacteria bacterium]|nr:phosphonate metabolism protein/1,5-bisphosphokinase (PRPP-forming) PhnN [Gammaproteobacteria bacterium]
MGRLFYVVGASGAGKDALMQAARVVLAGKSILFAHRYITRSNVDTSENFVQLLDAEFAQRKCLGLFWLSWQSHQLNYAVGTEVRQWLQAGIRVVVNGSRQALPEVARICAQDGIKLIPVWVHCEPSVLAQRLRARGRENEQQIQERLERAKAFVPPDDALVIDNSGALTDSVQHFITYLQGDFREETTSELLDVD